MKAIRIKIILPLVIIVMTGFTFNRFIKGKQTSDKTGAATTVKNSLPNVIIILADDLGYELKNINSELLASLLRSENVREDFQNLVSEIKEFFDNM